jgi:transcriptional regulator with XRE-family HTH domain
MIINSGYRIKIGMSQNPKQRMQCISSTTGIKIERQYLSPKCYNYVDIENQLHQSFKDDLIKGEWYNTSFENAVEQLNKIDFVIINNDDNEHEEENLKKIIGYNLEKRRKNLKLSQDQLSEMSHISKMAISKMERYISLPSTDTLFKLAIALRIDMNYFFTGIDNITNIETSLESSQSKLLFLYKSLNTELRFSLLDFAHYLVYNLSENNQTSLE